MFYIHLCCTCGGPINLLKETIPSRLIGKRCPHCGAWNVADIIIGHRPALELYKQVPLIPGQIRKVTVKSSKPKKELPPAEAGGEK